MNIMKLLKSNMLIPEGRNVRETKQGNRRREGKKEKHIFTEIRRQFD